MNGGINKMSVKSCEKIEKSQVVLTIEVGAPEFEAAIEKAYQKMRKKINVPGFRPGKAPRKVIEGMYGAEVFFEEAINIAFPDAYEAAVKEQELQVVGYPTVELVGECTKDGFTFKATTPVYPEVTLGEYKGLKAEKPEVKVLAADVDERLKELSDRNTRLVSVDREAKEGDTVVIDFEGFLEGKPFEGGKGENFSLELGSHTFVPGFEEQLVGVKAGDEKDLDITFPEDYHKDLAGKAVVFKVKVHEVKEKEIPALDDEFAKDVSEFDTLKDLKADLKFVSHRTDLIEDGTFDGYVAAFQKLYPNITIKYEGITDYANDMTTRLTSNDWGDLCMIPTNIPLTELGDYFEPLCALSDIENEYNFASNRAYNGSVYGIPSTGNAQGIIYNKKVFEAAGITTLPKTPDEFLDDLQKIKDYDPSIDPLYTNYAAGWTMTAWDAYTSGGATGDPNWMSITMPQTKDPFQKGILGADDMGPYAVYYILYEAVKRGLTEADPTTTDWEGSKPRINNGQIGAMVLGSWAIVQMQAAGDHADDIGYMPFPITVKGTQYASAGADYCYGVNKNTTDDKKLAAMLYIKWLTESSNFAYDQGGVPVLKSQEYPDTLKAFDGIDLVEDAPAPAELADLATEVQQEAELMLNADQTHVMRVVEAGINGDETLDDIVADWNAAWDAAVDACAPQ